MLFSIYPGLSKRKNIFFVATDSSVKCNIFLQNNNKGFIFAPTKNGGCSSVG